MATITLTPVKLAWNVASSDVDMTAAQAINAADTYKFPFPKDEKTLLFVKNTAASAKNVTISAGFGIASGQGDLTVSLNQNETKAFQLSSDRFKQSDGTVQVTFETGTTGYIQVIELA